MNLKPTGVGAQPKKIAILIGLVLVAIYFYWSNSQSETHPEQTASRRPAATAGSAPAVAVRSDHARTRQRRAPGETGSTQQFRPSLVPAAENAVSPSEIDPTLRLDLLARLQKVPLEGGQRSLFEFSQAPVPLAKEPGKIPIHGQKGSIQIAQGPPVPSGPPPPPPPAPIPLQFYGFVAPASQGAPKRAFFLDGDDIFVAGEGDLVKKKYKILRIGVNSAVVEDTGDNHQQTLALVPQQPEQG
ncbi:MAG TPA: hypothetical protein VN610_03580 [Bryobacteraceae bacterium]|nr:hypothetical protein [Bryobacteraceae bacterium]